MQSSGPFALPATREAWEAAAVEREDIVARARAINAWLDAVGARRVASYGVGGASLEYLLHHAASGRELLLTDYGSATVGRLAALFHEVEVRHHDLLTEPPLDADVHLFHRIDTELTNPQWKRVFDRFAYCRILVVATEVASLGRAVAELRIRLRNRRASRAGWMRTRSAFESLWSRTHAARPLAVHDLQAWDLTPLSRGRA
jgi:hypothetical protein